MFERTFAMILLIIISPLFILIYLFVIFFSGYPVFYRHNRSGFKYNEFEIYKFRTMRKNEGSNITKFNDSRITKIGKFLRITKLDELPQLINIIKGEMVFIGPRPEIPGLVNRYPHYFSYLKKTKPGVSGLDSIIFKNEADIFKKIHINKYEYEILPVKHYLSLIFIKNQNIIYRIILIFLSILAIINHKLSLHIISKFFLPYDETEFRKKLNYLLSKELF